METGESDVRYRGDSSQAAASKNSDNDADDQIVTEENVEQLTKGLNQPAESSPSLLDTVLTSLPPRWRNWMIRGIFSLVMIFGFASLVYMGPVALMLLVLVIQLKCYKEIIDIGFAVYRVHDLPWFRSLSWYLLICSNYYFCGESLIENWGILLRKDNFLNFLIKHHRFIGFSLYCGGFMWFVLSLKKGYYMRQFSVFAYTHVALFLLVLGSCCIAQNIIQGLIWFLVPVSMIICNDIMAYMFGFFLGKTSLIELSPKKTWEGFIGGALSTVLFGFVLSQALMRHPFLVCPLEWLETPGSSAAVTCTIPSSFVKQEFPVPEAILWIFKLLRKPAVIRVEPFLGHAVILGLFASIVGPFGGFFASGFKRAFKIKDFGDVIPGHGGLMDRFDCQVIMGAFVWVYIQTFIAIPSPAKLVQQILFLPPDMQLEVYRILGEELTLSGLIANSTLNG